MPAGGCAGSNLIVRVPRIDEPIGPSSKMELARTRVSATGFATGRTLMSVGCCTPPAGTFSVTTPPAAVSTPPCVPIVPPSTMSSVALPSCEPTAALIVAWPELNALTAPLEVTLATLGALELQVTVGPEITPPVTLVAVATRLIDSPTIVGLFGAPETITAATSGLFPTPVESPLPPHADAASSSPSMRNSTEWRGDLASMRLTSRGVSGSEPGQDSEVVSG